MASVEDYKKLILSSLYEGFIKNPRFRIDNVDVEKFFGKIENKVNFNLAREQLIQDGLIYGKNFFDNELPFFSITGEGIIYYEKNFIFPTNYRLYTILMFKFLSFLRDLVNGRYDIKNFILKNNSSRDNKVEIPLSEIEKILKENYDYLMDDLRWNMLHSTTEFINTLVNGINGIHIGKACMRIYDINNFSLRQKGSEFLNSVFFIEKFQKIKNVYGRNRVIQLYNDIDDWISKERWVDVAINMGVIIEYLIDVYAQKKGLKDLIKVTEFYNKLSKILENYNSSIDPIFDQQYKPLWNRIRNVIRDWRNYVHITKLVKESNPLDEESIKKFYEDFEAAINILLN
ncbi:MAG: hypothetical protein ACTSVV_14745 [Promethearchaeota archaeon]